jgi:hypothetical protein
MKSEHMIYFLCQVYNFLFSILYTNLKIDIKLAKNKIKHYKNIQNAG